MNDRQSDFPVCPDCGESLDAHCKIWTPDGDVLFGGLELQCPRPVRCIALTGSARANGTDNGRQCKRRAVWFHHRIGWCTQHAPSYLKEANHA